MSERTQKDSAKIEDSPTVNSPEKITEEIINCTDLQTDQNILKNTQTSQKHESSSISAIPESESGLALEQITENMTQILDALKENLRLFEMQQDSFSDVGPQIEQLYQKRTSKMNNAIAASTKKQKKESKQNGSAKNVNKTVDQPKPSTPTNNNANKRLNNTASKNNEKNNPKGNIQSNKDSVTTNRTSTNSPGKPRVNNPALVVKALVGLPPRQMYNPLGVIRDEVQLAMKNGKTFTVRGGFNSIRNSLHNRGWIEKIHPMTRGKLNDEMKKFNNYNVNELVDLLRHKDIAEICRKMIKSKLLENVQVDLYWSSNYEAYKECSDKVKLTKINKLRRGDGSFSSKLGLAHAARKSFVLSKTNPVRLNHPRTYNLAPNGDTEGFIKDFNLTAAMSLLKWVKKNSETKQFKIISPSGKIPLSIFDFAVTECYKMIKKSEHPDVNDTSILDAFDHEWTDFLVKYYKTVHVGNHFKLVENISETDLVRKATFILDKLRDIWPFLDMDGLMNIWILKPINSSQGVGIHMCRTLNYVLNVVKNNPNRRYIIQKYIERPLLIYNTKFDIRQWFLISSTSPLSIWVYKQCYIRFSSQTYNLRKLHESIHLTNNSVQRKYNNITTSRDFTLPPYNMWNSNQFENYLSDMGFPNAFKDIVYPGMKESIIMAILLHQHSLDRRKNSFELFGADFMLTEDFKPWLLEINSNPALHASTPITARMCPQMLADVIKVIIDYENDPKASTGAFELAYRGTLIKTKDIPTSSNQLGSSQLPKTLVPTTIPIDELKRDPTRLMKTLGHGMKQTLEDLLKIMKKHKNKKDNTKKHSISTTFSFINPKVNHSVETINSIACIETQTVSKIKIIDISSDDKFLKGEATLRNNETNTTKYTKEYILNLLMKKLND